MEDSIFIKVLEHGEEVGLEGTNMSFLKNYIEKRLLIDFTQTDQKHKKIPLEHLLGECFEKFQGGKNGKNYILKTEYYFRLVEYRELQEARAAAKSANRNAFIAIGISIFTLVVSAVLTFTQLNIPTTINKSDLQTLINSNAVQRDVKLDNLQMAQILSVIESRQSKLKPQKPKAIFPSNEVQHHDLINKYFEEE